MLNNIIMRMRTLRLKYALHTDLKNENGMVPVSREAY